MPFALLFLLFVFLEIAGFVAMANAIGLFGVFALIVAGIVAGGLIIRTIGLASVARMQQRANEGAPVGQEMGGLVLGFLGGVLVIMPGFLTDLLGLALLVKPVQMLVWPRYGRQMAGRMPNVGANGNWRSPGRSAGQAPGHENQRPSSQGPSVVVEGEVVDAPASQQPDDRPEGSAQNKTDENPWAR